MSFEKMDLSFNAADFSGFSQLVFSWVVHLKLFGIY